MSLELIKRKVRKGNRTFFFEILSADNFTVTPPMSREIAEGIVWNIIVQPNHKIKRSRPKRRGGIKGA